MSAQGTASVDFGSFPGSSQTTASVTGQATIGTSNQVEAWIRPQNGNPGHSVDEHIIEQLKITAGNIVAGTGFTIYAECLNGFAYGAFDVNWVWA
jgi:hypothetical protein